MQHIPTFKQLSYGISLLILCFLTHAASCQIYDPVKWSTSVEQISQDEFDLVCAAEIEAEWHVYGQNIAAGGPIPTTLRYAPKPGYELKGKTQESEGQTIFDPVFGLETTYFEDRVEFRQRIIVSKSGLGEIEGEVEFMVCNDEQCLPPHTEPLTYKFPKTKVKPSKVDFLKEDKQPEPQSEASRPEQDSVAKEKTEQIKQEDNVSDVSTITSIDSSTSPVPKDDDSLSTDTPVDHRTPVEVGDSTDADVTFPEKERKSFWSIFFLSFLSGFAALLTPCVFPMIPLTVSFFTKQSKNRINGIKNAILYGVSIIIIYVLLGSLVTLLFGADALNAFSTNVWFNLLFFLILVIFAASFLGAFELVLPGSWGTKIDAQADRKGFVGIFFMALALAIVSFSCTGPIVGTLLVQAASEGGIAPIVGMVGFSSAIAIPFGLFAAFPGWLNSLPRSGGWLNTVKVVLGFLELALAFKFLSNADLVLQLHLLERETFLVIWIAIFGGLALYLLGKIRLPHDAPVTHISVGRLGLGLLVLAFTVYMIPGLWGAPLQWISGFPPPLQYSESPYGVGNSKETIVSASKELEEGMELGPLDILLFKDYDTGMAYAKKVDKPVMLDFTGYACVNCRKMEERVWPDPKVEGLLKNEVVLISLYVDDKKALPEDQQYISETTGRNIKTIGNKWSDFQIKEYKTNAQPYYVLLNHQGKKLNAPVAYNPDIESYASWLREGIENYKKSGSAE